MTQQQSFAVSTKPSSSWVYKTQWVALFLLATYALSRVFEASRALTGGLPTADWVDFSIWMAVLSATFLFLALDSYRKERTKGTVLRAKRVFDWLDAVLPVFPAMPTSTGKEQM